MGICKMNVLEETWSYDIDIDGIEAEYFVTFQSDLNTLANSTLRMDKDCFLLENINYQVNLMQTYNEQLKLLSEDNKNLKDEIECKLQEVANRQANYENYKRDYKLLAQEIKETHEAFLKAKKFYKINLKIYYCIEKRYNGTQVIFVQFFTENKKDNENYSVRLLRYTDKGQYELQNINPNLKQFKELQKILLQTNDVPGALCSVRQAFLELRKNKQ